MGDVVSCVAILSLEFYQGIFVFLFCILLLIFLTNSNISLFLFLMSIRAALFYTLNPDPKAPHFLSYSSVLEYVPSGSGKMQGVMNIQVIISRLLPVKESINLITRLTLQE